MKDGKVKIRLLRAHYLNGRKKPSGSVIRLAASSAEWLIANGRAVEFKVGRR